MATSGDEEGGKALVFGTTTLPVEDSVDLLVLGASFAGAAVAHAAASAGHHVVLVEPRAYPGREATATLRLRMPARRVPRVVAPWLDDAARPARRGEYALHPDTLKRGLEDALLEAGVGFYYASQPCGLVYDADRRVRGAVIGNKSGRQAVLARLVVDATEEAMLARLGGVAMREEAMPALVGAWRTLEFTGVADDLPDWVSVPPDLGLIDDRLRVHDGYLGDGHVFLECALSLEREAPGLPGRMGLEIAAREYTMAVVAHLASAHPAFNRAMLAGSSWELALPCPYRLAATAPERAPIAVDDAEGRGRVLMGAIIDPRRPGLVVLGPASAAGPDDAAILAEPLAAAQVGEALAPEILSLVGDEALPAPDNLIARCGSPTADGSQGAMEVREPRGPQRGRAYPRVSVPEERIPLLADVDVLVVGGGTSGAPAAALAASGGADTALVEMNCGLGGTGTLGGVDSYWFGRRVGVTAMVDARYQAEAARLCVARDESAKWNIEARMHALLRWTTEAGAHVFFRTIVVAALLEGDAVRGVALATPDGLRVVRARVVIDASGDGDVAAFAGARFIYGSARDRLPLWYSLAQFARPGRTRNNFTSAVDVSNVRDYTRAILAGRRRGSVYDHGTYLAPRETRHILGGVVHTLTDQLTLRRFPDVVALCFSNSDIKGKSAADWVLWGLLPPNVESEIAYRALVPDGLDGLLIAGKALSCTHDALPALRMQADLQNVGGACALAALLALEQDVAPRAIAVRELQRRLVDLGALPPEMLGREITARESAEAELRALVDGLTGDEPFYVDMGFDDVQREPLTLVRVCTAGPRIVPLLASAYESASGRRRLLLARLLAWYGSNAGMPCLIEAIEAMMAERGTGTDLPGRAAHIRYAGDPPDQGAMPELCYLLYALGMARDARSLPVVAAIVERLNPTAADFRDRVKGTFYYVDAACYVAERLGSPAAIPLLLALHGMEGLHGRHATAYDWDYFEERIAYLEVVIGRALARCGSPAGAAILIDYLSDARALLAEHAHDELLDISGQDLGKDADGWRAWLTAQGASLTPHPWLDRIE